METSLAILAGIFGLGTTELVVILLVLFGGAKLPGLAKGLGQSIKEFKKATNEEEKEASTKDEEKKVDPKDTHGNN